MEKEELKRPDLKKTNTLGGNRIRRSQDEFAVRTKRKEMQEKLVLSMSQQGLQSEDKVGVRSAMSRTAPEGLNLGKANGNLLIELDTTNPVDWEYMNNRVVGGKALHLAEMIAHTITDPKAKEILKVPRASVLTTFAYNDYITHLKLGPELNDIITGKESGPALAERLKKVREEILKGEMEHTLKQLIEQFSKTFSKETRFAVRSSSTMEDTGGASFAGQYETILNVPPKDIVEAVKKCWASMWQERLIEYRKNVGFTSEEKLSMAVVIQQQIPSEAAGVAFSMNPINGNSAQTIVEAVYGQGEGLVGGTITPHSFVVNWVEHRIDSRTQSEQETKIMLREHADREHGFVEVVPTTEQERKQPPLTDAQAFKVAEMALIIAASYHVPYDIEYARVGNDIYLLQARPITSFSVQVEGTDSSFDYAGFDDSCPLTLSMSAHAYATMMARTLRTAGGEQVEEEELVRSFFCKAYINSRLWGMFTQKLNVMRKSIALETLVEQNSTLVRDMNALAQSFAEDRIKVEQGTASYPDTFLRFLEAQDKMNTASFVVGEAVEFFENKVKSYLYYLNDKESKELSLASFVDGINWDSEASYSSSCLLAVARLFASDALVAKTMIQNGTLTTLKKLNTEHSAKCVEVFEGFVKRFFFLSNRDEDMSGKRWGDDITVPWSLVAANVKGMKTEKESVFESHWKKANEMLSAAPKVVQSRETEEFHKAMNLACEGIGVHLAEQAEFHCSTFTSFVESLRRLLHLKEEIHVVYTVNNFHTRRAFVAAAFHAKIASKSSEDYDGYTLLNTHPLFSLDFNTVKGKLWQVEPEKRIEIIKNADLMRQMFSGMKVPSSVGLGQRHEVENEEDFTTTNANFVSGQTLKGIGCSSGRVTGTACVIHSLDEAPKMNKGDVLVTKYTDPSWCPLFSLASAVVLVDGGVLSHASIVSREMGIPCVMQIKNAMSLSGKQIVVDGTKGVVIVSEEDK